MVWMPILAGRDHLAMYARQGAVDALVELIWNGLDAEADEVAVDIESSSIGSGDRAMYFVTRIKVSDNGHGITPEIAKSAFPSLGDSWKRKLNGRTLNGKRAMHGRLGRGRFYAYALGSRASGRVYPGLMTPTPLFASRLRAIGIKSTASRTTTPCRRPRLPGRRSRSGSSKDEHSLGCFAMT
jgi:Histidine kinase-, DNA gyrase B-, and HSP90-like ATPase